MNIMHGTTSLESFNNNHKIKPKISHRFGRARKNSFCFRLFF